MPPGVWSMVVAVYDVLVRVEVEVELEVGENLAVVEVEEPFRCALAAAVVEVVEPFRDGGGGGTFPGGAAAVP